jgi:hypothetical protein
MLIERVPYNAFWAIDCFFSAITGGDKGETISARLWGQQLKVGIYGWPARIAQKALDGVVLLFFGQKDHTKSSYDEFLLVKAARAAAAALVK